MKLTRIDLNSWLLQIAGLTVLIDPWLVDPLIFYGQPWLFTAYHITPPSLTPATLPPIDLILISQGLDDHCHQPTLQQLNRKIPVVASLTAAKVVRRLGYETIAPLSHWQEIVIQERLQITAIPGAVLQPGQEENGYFLKDRLQGETLYYEPHLFRPELQLQQRIGSVDLAIAPAIGQIFPLLGTVIMGPTAALDLAKTLQPRFFVPTASGEIQTSGILPRLIRSVGSLSEFNRLLTQAELPTQLLTPAPGETVEINS